MASQYQLKNVHVESSQDSLLHSRADVDPLSPAQYKQRFSSQHQWSMEVQGSVKKFNNKQSLIQCNINSAVLQEYLGFLYPVYRFAVSLFHWLAFLYLIASFVKMSDKSQQFYYLAGLFGTEIGVNFVVTLMIRECVVNRPLRLTILFYVSPRCETPFPFTHNILPILRDAIYFGYIYTQNSTMLSGFISENSTDWKTYDDGIGHAGLVLGFLTAIECIVYVFLSCFPVPDEN